jgi:hypothetical protein
VETELVPDGNPPTIFRTLDNIEWIFLQTLPDYDTLDKFQRKNKCARSKAGDKSARIRCYCTRKRVENCKFMLLAVKTTKQQYHVYSYGEHNHPVHNIKSEGLIIFFN